MTLQQKILKATLMLRKLGNRYQTKEEQLVEFKNWYTAERESELDEWIEGLKEELAKTPEQLEEESQKFCEELAKRETEMEYQERMRCRHDRDEWNDYWADAARSVGAVNM